MFDEEPQKLEDRIKFMYLCHEGRVLTIARQYNKEDNSVTYGYALCCRGDQFSRRVGRRIAINRLKNEYKTVACGNERAIDVSIKAIASESGFMERYGYMSPAMIAKKELEKRNLLDSQKDLDFSIYDYKSWPVTKLIQKAIKNSL